MDSFAIFLHERTVAGAVLQLLVNGTLTALCIVPCSLLLVLLLRRASASARHLVMSLAFLGMLAVPVVSLFLPVSDDSQYVAHFSGALPVQTEPLDKDPAGGHVSASFDQQSPVTQPPLRSDERQPAPDPPDTEPPVADLWEQQTPPESINTPVADYDDSVAAEPIPTSSIVQVSLRQVEVLVTVLWCVGVVLIGLRVLLGQIMLLRTLRSGAQISDLRFVGIARDALSDVGLERTVTFVESDRCSMPMTCGLLHPAVVLPSAARGWSTDRLRMVLVHELAHVKRRDCLWQWIVLAVTACQWYNPLVWLAAARLRSEQEQACDDAVLNSSVRASDYAQTLLEISTGCRRHWFALGAGIAMARSHRLSSRVRAIVDERRNRRTVSRRVCIAAGLIAILLIVPLSQVAQAIQIGSETASPGASREQPVEAADDDQLAAPENDTLPRKRQRIPGETVMITLPGGHTLAASADTDALVDSALALLNSTRALGHETGYRDSAVMLLFSPPREIPFSFGGPVPSKPKTVRLSRLYIDVGNALGPGDIVTENDGPEVSFAKHQLSKWIAFRREFDHLVFCRPRPIVPAVGEWSKPVNGLQARLSVDNWRDPIIGVFLELKNVKDLANTMTVPLDAEDIGFELRDGEGNKIPEAHAPRSGPVVDLKNFKLPYDSSLRFNLSVGTVGISPGDNAVIAMRIHDWRILPGDLNPYQLSASFAVKNTRPRDHAIWHGELQVPAVTIQPAPREKRPDRIMTRSYPVDAGKWSSIKWKLTRIFATEQDVTIFAGERITQIKVRAAESRHGFIGGLVAALNDGDPDKLLPPSETRLKLDTIDDITKALTVLFPEWALHESDSKLQPLADGYRGYRFVLRRTWKEDIGAVQRQQPGPPTGPFKERHEDWEFVLVPVQPKQAPASFKSRIQWQQSNSPYHTRDVCLGTGHGYVWFTHGTIFNQHRVRQKFELRRGDDPIQLLVDGLLVDDTGTATANSSIWLLGRYGDRALPYLRTAIEQARKSEVDPWKVVVSLQSIQTPQATDMLIGLIDSGEDDLRGPAGYALIHKPYRETAKRAYLAMLKDHMYVERAAEICVEFEWEEAIPILQDLMEHPKYRREFQYALHARRALEGRPVAKELLAAEQTLRWSGGEPGKEVTPQQRKQNIAAARQLLIESKDAKAANLAALNLALFFTKGDASAVRETGVEILRLRPRDETLLFLTDLSKRLSISGDRRSELEKVIEAVAR